MQFVYKPEGADPKRWEFDPDRLMNAEAEAIERHTGLTYGEWAEKVSKGSMLALHGLLFVLLKRDMPTLKWDQVQFSLADLDFEVGDDEARTMRDGLLARAAEGPLSDEDQQRLDLLNEQIGDDASDEAPAPKG